jgi:hypothetical protein
MTSNNDAPPTTPLTRSGSLVAGSGRPVRMARSTARHRRLLAAKVTTPVSTNAMPTILPAPAFGKAAEPLNQLTSAPMTTRAKAVVRHAR